MSFANAVKKAEVKESTKAKKDDKPVVDDTELYEAVDGLVKAKADKKKSEAIIKKAESVILPVVAARQDADALEMRHSKSYRVMGNDEVTTYVTQDRFIVSANDEKNLKELFGEDGFNDRFEKDESLAAKKEIFSDEKLQTELFELLGEENFAKFFEYKAVLKTKKGYDLLQYKDKEKLEDARVFVKQYKAALR